ncbi:DUF2254 domain-containing protein [Marivita sp.]|uniref:DUF2254 domain-containing protein n=1 Tax=Marivita sp. TaxID=2003365 RepID=UPI003F70B84B
MRERILLWLKRLWHRPGVRISIFGMAALAIAALAPFFDRSIPADLKDRLPPETVLPILNILASSMLAVTTFSLGIMVQAFRAAAGQATPRAYRILMQDMTTQNVLSVFVGAFLFSLSAIVMFRAGLYGEGASVVVFGMTLVCILLIIIAILRWIAHLSLLGSMDHTLMKVEAAAKPPLNQMADAPNLGARPAEDAPKAPDQAATIFAPRSGFVQHISMAALDEKLDQAGATLWVLAPPGRWVLEGMPLARVLGDANLGLLAEEFTIGDDRNHEQDARFGLVILSEIASRALSPGVNDPGTAIDVIHRLERVLWDLGLRMTADDRKTEPRYRNVIAGKVSASDLLQDGFAALMEDGGGRFDVMSQVLKASSRLSRSDWQELSDAARATQERALTIIDRRIGDPETAERLKGKANA